MEQCPYCEWRGGLHDPVCPYAVKMIVERQRRMELYRQGLAKGREDREYFAERVNAYIDEETTAWHLGHQIGIFGG